MYERSKTARGIVLVSLCAVAAFALLFHLSRRGIVVSRTSGTYRVFGAPADPSIQARIGNRKTRNDIFAAAVMIWNRGDVTIRSPRAVRIVLEPRRPIVAVRTLVEAKKSARLAIDSRRASSGEITISWAALDPDDGVAIHFAAERAGTAIHVEHLPTSIYWAAGWRAKAQFIFLWVVFALGAAMAVLVRPSSPTDTAVPAILAILAVCVLAMAAYLLPGYVQNPPAKLRAAIAMHYPQETVFPE